LEPKQGYGGDIFDTKILWFGSRNGLFGRRNLHHQVIVNDLVVGI